MQKNCLLLSVSSIHKRFLILSKFLCFKNEIAHFLNIDRTEISADFCKTLSKHNQSALIRRITSNFTCRHSINIKTLQVFVFEMPYYMYTNYTIPCVGNCPVKGDFCYQRGILHGNTTANRDYSCGESRKSDTYLWRAQGVDRRILCRPCCAYITP